MMGQARCCSLSLELAPQLPSCPSAAPQSERTPFAGPLLVENDIEMYIGWCLAILLLVSVCTWPPTDKRVAWGPQALPAVSAGYGMAGAGPGGWLQRHAWRGDHADLHLGRAAAAGWRCHLCAGDLSSGSETQSETRKKQTLRKAVFR